MPKIDIETAPERRGTRYPKPYDTPCLDRVRQQLGDAGGLTQFGVNLLTLQPGVWSAQRHWHVEEDEFVFVVSGEVVLIDDAGEHVLKAGDCAAFKANDPNGHHLVNKSAHPAQVLEVGTRTPGDKDTCYYPDADLVWDGPKGTYTTRDGTPYPEK
ncbi:cupin domain-containing protein [Rhizomicrobium electricum]|uniref:Cupin domain-containing protein n=1 Tax=Rhizomicrobium electricum TaxID=480070 RepID=A0ABP3Q272_9PROT|nr:cupin domain-containing protein [Rhizomicrobium electricum]NIJ49291.1 putative cupin superfamily protein [Rhizomicrobium electricum]